MSPNANTQLLLKSNLKQLRLPAMHAEFEKLAREAFHLAHHKLPIPTRMVKREESL